MTNQKMIVKHINPIKATSIKKFMKMNGIHVLRCIQSGKGIVVTVSDDKENIDKAIQFFLDYGLGRKEGYSIPSVVSKGKGYADFGNLYSITSDIQTGA